ncbi:lipoprotein [Leminorella grimontii]|uniref:Lipoprotein n=1 Tax=Leminorella grimontii TaxID=82981 RepID=A0AAV5N2Y4_9GAMM|nr:hypothetical protein [Leminorella grimontii]KFC93427.1 hypothetical protein GLGR_2990 [Leminorella grimontii ATCC 33999 = DSM 5078]GKX55878.1 lipoprotein [Leminorella grimontii]VFS54981.1 Uncharacterised protein [Leminorella grimontii]
MNMKSLKALLVGLIAVIFITGCSGNVAARNISTDLDGSFTNQQIEKAIMDSGKARGWEMKKMRTGLITGKIVTRGNSAEIRIPYTKTGYSIEYVGSQNLTSDTAKVPSNYNRWASKLDQDIQNKLLAVKAL